MGRKFITAVSASIFGILFNVFPVFAQENKSPAAANLDEITVYATRSRQPLFDVPAMVSKSVLKTQAVESSNSVFFRYTFGD